MPLEVRRSADRQDCRVGFEPSPSATCIRGRRSTSMWRTRPQLARLLKAPRRRSRGRCKRRAWRFDVRASNLLRRTEAQRRQGLTWRAIASVGPLKAEAKWTSDPTFPFGAHAAVVALDTEVGRVHLRRFVAVDDAGVVYNHELAKGHVHGGVAQGIATALFEEMVYDSRGQPSTPSLESFGMPGPADLPFVRVHSHNDRDVDQRPRRHGCYRVRSNRSGRGSVSAVNDALCLIGAPPCELPATPQNVWRSLSRIGDRP